MHNPTRKDFLPNKRLVSRFCGKLTLLAGFLASCKSCLILQILQILLLFVGIIPTALSQDFAYTGEKVEAQGIIVTAIEQDMHTRVPARSLGVDGQAAQATAFEVTYTGFTPEAQAAFQHAVNITSSIISSPVTIRVAAEFKQFESERTLGSARANYFRRISGVAGGLWLPDALADKLTGLDLGPGEPDIVVEFTNREGVWYYGTDGNTPAGQFDLVTVVLHELFHGLGSSAAGRPLTPELGTVRLWVPGPDGLAYGFPGFYDYYVIEGATTTLADKLIDKYEDPSAELLAALIGGNLYWVGGNGVANNGGIRPKLYAPNPWNQGSSYSHLDEATYPAGNPNSLMTPRFGSAESIHDPGDIIRGMFTDMLWGVIPNAPTVTFTEPTGTQTGSFNVLLTFSESVTGFDAADVTLDTSLTAGAGNPTFSVSGSGTTYTVSITPAANTAGYITVSVRKNAATAGTTVIPAPATPQNSRAIAFGSSPVDNAPTVVIGGPERANAAFDVTFNFSEALGTGADGFTASDIDASGPGETNPTVSEPTLIDSTAHIYTVRVTPASTATDGDITVTLNPGSVQDAGGNAIAAADINTATVKYDITPPTVTVARPSRPSGTPQTGTAHHPFTVQIDFNEPVTGFETTDITVNAGTVTSLAGSDENYIATITPVTDGNIVVTVYTAGVADHAGNAGTTSFSVTVSYDTGPTVMMSTPKEYVNTDFVVFYTFNQKLDASSFTAADIRIRPDTAATLLSGPTQSAGDEKVWTTTIRPTAEGNITVALDLESGGSVTDETGNPLVNTGSTRDVTVIYDSTPPTVAVSAPTASAAAYHVTFTFNEEIDEHSFVETDVTLTGTSATGATKGTPTPAPSDAKVYTMLITPSASSGGGDITATLTAASVTDIAGNPFSTTGPELSATTSYSNVAPTFNSSDTVFTVVENSTLVGDANAVSATDLDAPDNVTYALSGADSGSFSISYTGVLSFSTAPNFENPADQESVLPANTARNNEYIVEVIATGGIDERAKSVSKTIHVIRNRCGRTAFNPLRTDGAPLVLYESTRDMDSTSKHRPRDNELRCSIPRGKHGQLDRRISPPDASNKNDYRFKPERVVSGAGARQKR